MDTKVRGQNFVEFLVLCCLCRYDFGELGDESAEEDCCCEKQENAEDLQHTKIINAEIIDFIK